MSLLTVLTHRTFTQDLTAFHHYLRTCHPALDFIAQCKVALSEKCYKKISETLTRLLRICRDLDVSCSLSEFLDYGGVDILSWQLRICAEDMRTLHPCLIIVKELERSHKPVLTELCLDAGVLAGIFKSLKDEPEVDKVVLLLEELLSLFLPRNYSLLHVPSFFNLLQTAHSRALAYLCRILAYLLYDSEDKLDLFKSTDPVRKSFGPSTLETNHCVIVSVPGLIPRLCSLLDSPHVAILAYLPSRDIEDTSRQDIWSATHLDPTELNAQELASHQIEVVFVLSVLLAGPRRLQVAQRLLECDFVRVICRLFDVLDWKIAGKGGNAEPALKIQLLRLINNYCEIKSEERFSAALVTDTERSSVYEDVVYNLLSCHLYNYEDLVSVYEFKHGFRPPTTLDFLSSHSLPTLINKLVSETNPSKRWKKPVFTVEKAKQGLMTRLVQAFKECEDNTNKLLLSSCIEGFLRSADVFTQLFIIQTGLLSDMLAILNDDTCESNIIQATFDLLGEVLKFNKGAFLCLNHLISSTEQRRWVDYCMTKIVDSNVFLRSLLLSTSYFDSIDSHRTDFFLKKFAPKFSTSLAIFNRFHDQSLSILSNLLKSIQVKSLSQDSNHHIDISCLNTSIMFFILCSDKSRLLAILRKENPEIVDNFNELLSFWLRFYLRRGRDAHGIQQSSRVEFGRWKATVEELRRLLQLRV